jgi:23S rRNA (cytidine2498-2'-O)-methyltransferase
MARRPKTRGGPGRRDERGRPHKPQRPHKPRPDDRNRRPQLQAPPAPPRVDPAKLEACLRRDAPLREGEWLWTMREGAERDLIEELLLRNPASEPRRLGPALVASRTAPAERDGRLDVTFARQGFKVTSLARASTPAELAEALAPSLLTLIGDAAHHALHVFVPDSAAGNLLTDQAEALRAALPCPSHSERVDEATLRRHGARIIHVCLHPDRDGKSASAALGCSELGAALSLWPGGRARMKLAGNFPSRAARKLAEAFAWLGTSPGSGEVCVDLGAAPGGWSWLLLEQRARVIAVDPARMDAALMRNPRLRHVQGSAFDYAPDEPVDWLFCDMAWRPLEVAQMLGRWARLRQTRMLVANFKLPMKRKVEMVERLRSLLEQSGFSAVRMRQLYHDREEISLTAHVR